MSDSVWPHRRQPTRLPRPWDSPGKNTGMGCHFLLQCRKVKSESEVAQSCPALSDPMDCSPPGSSVHGIFQARVLEWSTIAFSMTYFYLEKTLTSYMSSYYLRAGSGHSHFESLIPVKSLTSFSLISWRKLCALTHTYVIWLGSPE